MRRVVITGVGAVSAHGLGAPALFSGLLEGKSSTHTLSRFDPAAFPSRVAGEVPAFKAADFVPKSYRKATKIMARDIELAVVAADFAVRDAKLATKGILETSGEKVLADGFTKVDPARVGCNIGAGLICADLDELSSALVQARDAGGNFSLTKWGRSEDPAKTSGMDNLTPLWLLKYLPNMLACHVSIIHDTQGPSNTITCAQASAGLALAEACRSIQRGKADVALVGGCESKVHPMGLLRWTLLNRLNVESNDTPETACRPLDESAAGTVIAEGGAVLVIEELEHAKARGATIYAEIAGLGSTATAQGAALDPAGETQAAALAKALKNANVAADDVQLIIPASYGIAKQDAADVAALKSAFGAALAGASVVPTHGAIGDAAAGAQALDLVVASMALQQQVVPPGVNCKTPRAGLTIPQQKTQRDLTHAVVVASALGGQNSAIVLRRYRS